MIHLDRQPRTSRRREAQTGSRARSGSRSERTLDAVEHSRTLMEWWPFLIFHRGGLRIKVINNNCLPSNVHAVVPSTPAERSACVPRFFKRGDWPAYVCLKISSGCRTHSDCRLHGARGKVKQAAKWRLAVSRIQTGIVSRRKAVGRPPPSAQGVHSHSRRGTRRIATSRDSRAGEPEKRQKFISD